MGLSDGPLRTTGLLKREQLFIIIRSNPGRSGRGVFKTTVMQREIKFRAWDGKQMHLPEHSDDSDFYISCDGVVRYIKEVGVEGHTVELPRNEYTLMQYTGLKDISGVDIYEGDVCESGTGDYWLVKFVNGCFYFVDRDGRNRNTYDYLQDSSYWKHRVIGNIHEHPDLITVPTTHGNG